MLANLTELSYETEFSSSNNSIDLWKFKKIMGYSFYYFRTFTTSSLFRQYHLDRKQNYAQLNFLAIFKWSEIIY